MGKSDQAPRRHIAWQTVTKRRDATLQKGNFVLIFCTPLSYFPDQKKKINSDLIDFKSQTTVRYSKENS